MTRYESAARMLLIVPCFAALSPFFHSSSSPWSDFRHYFLKSAGYCAYTYDILPLPCELPVVTFLACSMFSCRCNWASQFLEVEMPCTYSFIVDVFLSITIQHYLFIFSPIFLHFLSIAGLAPVFAKVQYLFVPGWLPASQILVLPLWNAMSPRVLDL